MRKIKIVCSLVMFLTCLSCSDSNNDDQEKTEFAMTAKINGVLYEMNNPFGTNEASGSIFSYYPDEDYIMLQGRFGGVFGNPEINIWINRNDLKVGTYSVGRETDGEDTHIDLIESSNDTLGNPIYENTISGAIIIDFIDVNEKVVKGTFEFSTTEGDETFPVNFNITEGTFNYRYDVE